MSTEILQVEARLQDFISANLKTLESNIGNFSNKVQGGFGQTTAAGDKLLGTLKGLGAAWLSFEGAKRAIGFFKEASTELVKYNQLSARLQAALGGSTRALKEQAEVLSRSLGIEDNEILRAEIRLGNYIKDEAQIRKLIPAIIDLAKAKEMDLASAAEMVARGIASDSEELGRLKIKVEGANGSAERISSTIKGLTANFGGQALAMKEAGDGAGSLNIAWKDLLKTVGEKALPAVKAMNAFSAATINFITSNIRKPKEGISELENSIKLMEVRLAESASAGWSKKLQEGLQRAIDDAKKKLGTLQTKEAAIPTVPQLPKTLTNEERKAIKEKAEKAADAWKQFTEEHQGFGGIGGTTDFGAQGESPELKIAEEENERKKELLDDFLKKKHENWEKQREVLNKEDAVNEALAEKERLRKERNLQLGAASAVGIIRNLQVIGQASKANSNVMKRLAQGEALINTAVGATKTLTATPWPPVNFALMATTIAAGMAQIALIEQQSFAKGGTAKPGMAMVGEQGPELVRFGSPAQVFNNKETKEMMKGDTINFHFAAGTDSSTVRSIERLLLDAERQGKLETFKKVLTR